MRRVYEASRLRQLKEFGAAASDSAGHWKVSHAASGSFEINQPELLRALPLGLIKVNLFHAWKS